MDNVYKHMGRLLGLVIASFFLFSPALVAQTSAPSLHGQVKDQSGAAVGATTVTVIGPAGATKQAQTDEQGNYTFRDLPPGAYTVQIRLKGFADFVKSGVVIAAGRPQVVDARLVVTLEKQEVNVKEDSSQVGVNPANNAGALVLKGDDLNILSDNPDDMQNDLQALAGPAAGPNGGQIYIDGFTGGTLPPKSSIREIRINQSPFAAEFERLGFGRIEIFTKPGTDKFHGRASFGFGDARFNSRNPFAPNRPPYQSKRFEGNLSGPISHKASFFLGFEQQNVDETSVVSAFILDPSLNVTPFSQAVLNPRKHTEFNPRIDYQLSTNNTLVARYSFEKRDQVNNGVGQFSLVSQGYNSAGTENGIQLSETAVLGPRAVNETRFRYLRTTDDILGATTAPTILVLSAFTGGGSSQGQGTNIQNRYELQNNTSLSLKKHQVRFGVRVRDTGLSDRSLQSYNGIFTFTSLNAYRLTLLGQQQGLTPALIRASGGSASQFSITAGNPLASINQYDLSLFAQDDWRVRPSFTLSYGLRYETQNHINDHHDFAPRVSLAWGLGKNKGRQPVTVIRAGAGIFYDRFGEDLTLQALRLNGINQQQFKVPNPDFFPDVPSIATLQGNGLPQTIRTVAAGLRSPYVVQHAIGIERQLPKNITVAVTYTNSHGVHSLRSRNINAPLPGTFDPLNPAAAVRPFGGVENIYQYESSGIYNQRQLITNINARVSPKFSLFGFYTLSSARSNSDGAGSFPDNQYNMTTEYGPAGFDVRQRFFMGGNIATRYGFSLSPFIVANSGQPFNIVAGRDLNGDSLFNDRPAFATDMTRPICDPLHVTNQGCVAQTIYGNFDTQPTPGERIIPRNFGRGPGQFSVNLRLSKTFTFGPETGSPGSLGGDGGHGPGGGGGHRGEGGPGGGLGPGGLSGARPGGMFGGGGGSKRYSMEFNIQARNIFNSVSLAPPIGNLSSPLFGHSNAIAGGFFGSSTANRRVELGLRFSF